jgi:hypothetical protein
MMDWKIEEDRIRFSHAFSQMAEESCGLNRKIGTLGEKTLHAVLKYFYEPDVAFQEVKVGPYVADIAREGAIVEIQTRAFDRLREKLSFYLSEGFVVTVVYPIPAIKWICKVNETNGELLEKRKSPKKGTVFDVMPELYKIKPLLGHKNLDFEILLLEVQDIRRVTGKRKGKKQKTERFECIPLTLLERRRFGCWHGYQDFLPDQLPETFTSTTFSELTHLSVSKASLTLNLLLSVGLVERIGKEGRSYLYHKTGPIEKIVSEEK